LDILQLLRSEALKKYIIIIIIIIIFVITSMQGIYSGRFVSPFLQATKALRESRDIALLYFLDRGTRRGEGSASRPGHLLPPGKTRYPLYRRRSGPQGRARHAENLAPTGIRSPERPERNQSRYRLNYRAHNYNDIPETNHVYRVYIAVVVLYLASVLHQMNRTTT
jgi:hypothetical protein